MFFVYAIVMFMTIFTGPSLEDLLPLTVGVPAVQVGLAPVRPCCSCPRWCRPAASRHALPEEIYWSDNDPESG